MIPIPRYTYTKVSQASVLLPVIAGLINYKRLTLPFRIFLFFFILAFGFEILSQFGDIIFRNNMPGLHLYVMAEFLAFSAVYYLHFREKSTMRYFILVNIVIGITLSVLNAFYVDSLLSPPALARSYSSFSITFYSLAGFYKMFRQDFEQYSWQYPMFWVNSGSLLYFTGQALYFPMINYLLKSETQMETYSLFVNQGLNIIAHCLYAQSFRCFRKQTNL